MSLQLRIVRDELQPSLEALSNIDPMEIGSVMGKEGQRVTHRHLLSKGTNKRGWPSTRFWSRAAKKTTFRAMPGRATIAIRQIGVAQRYYGGPIRPHKKQALTIPINSKAYGKTASDFPGLFMLKTKKGAYLVTSRKAGGKGSLLTFLFKLSKGVDQKPDPTVLPPEATINEAVNTGINQIVQRHYERRNK